MTEELLTNKIKTPDGTILQSFTRHDYKTHTDKTNNEVYMVDGGLDYLRRSMNSEPYEELSVTADMPHHIIRKEFSWGTYGKSGKDPLKRIALEELTTEHIKAIIENCWNISAKVENVLKQELRFRDIGGCHIYE